MMKFGLSPLTDTIYYGQVNEKRPNEWVGNKRVSVNCELNPTFICEIHGNCNIELGVKE